MRRVDQVLLWYPIAVFLAIGAYIVYQFTAKVPIYWGWDAIQTTNFVAFVLFGNFAHNFMSLWQLGRIEEFRQWSKIYRWHGLSIWQIVIATMIIFTAIVFWLPMGFAIFNPRTQSFGVSNIVIFILLAINAHHTLAQTKGLGIVLSHRYFIFSEEQRESFNTYNRFEKIFYRILLFDWFLYFAWALFLHKPYWSIFIVTRVVLLIGVYIWMASKHRLLDKKHASTKLLFNSRHLYRLFFGLHPIISFLAFGIHGADAMLTYWKTLGNSATPRKWFVRTEFIAFYILIGLYFFWIYQFYPTTDWTNRIFVAFFLTHYVSEGFMYRMRDTDTRRLIGPLL